MPKWSPRSTWAVSAPLGDARARAARSARSSSTASGSPRRAAAPGRRARRRPARRCRGRGRWRETGSQALGGAPMSTASSDASEALGGGHQQAVVGADEQAVLARPCAARRARARAARRRRRRGRRPPGGRPAGMKASASRSMSAPARTSWRGIAWVRSITRACGQRRAITPWQTPTNSSRGRSRRGTLMNTRSASSALVLAAAVGEERVDHARRCRGARPRRAARGRARAASRW